MPEPVTALLPHVRRCAVGFGPLLALVCVLVFAACAIAQGQSPSAGQRGEPVADSRESPTGIAGGGSAAAAPRPAEIGTPPEAVAQASSASSSAHDHELRLFFLFVLAILALRPIAALVSAVLRRWRERMD